MTDNEARVDLESVLADIRCHLEWQQESGPFVLSERAATPAPVPKAQQAAVAYARAYQQREPARPAPAPPAAQRGLARPPAAGAERITPASIPLGAPLPPPTRQAIPPPEVNAVVEPGQVRTLDELRRELGDCRRCKLCEQRKNIVFGVGNPRAELVFVGEGPGAEEDAQGVPFVGAAGALLTKMIWAMGYSRDDVYICNIVKCRPPENRRPEPDEIAACLPFVQGQLAAISPKAIVALGNVAAQALLNDASGITRLRGTWKRYGAIPLMPTFHPAYLLRKPEEKKNAWADLQQVMKLLGKRPARGGG